MEKERLDVLLTERGMVESRSLAQRLVMAGQVRVNGAVVDKGSTRVPRDAELTVDSGPRFVSRGGEKLDAALNSFHLTDLKGKTCVDVGASTGGFTDCLLQRGANLVYALDVGYGELHWKLRNDSRVVNMERTNARSVPGFTRTIDLVTVDASFISLRILLPVIKTWFQGGPGEVVALIKPQFEAGRAEAARGAGVIRDSEIHRKVLMDVLQACLDEGFALAGLVRSPLLGPKGNTEFLVHLRLGANESREAGELVSGVIPEG